MPLSPGDKLGPYEILAPLGAGGMGEVYKARDTRLALTVAVKVLPEHIAKREDLRARFERESRAVASLNHPNICTLYDIVGFTLLQPVARSREVKRLLQTVSAIEASRNAGHTSAAMTNEYRSEEHKSE